MAISESERAQRELVVREALSWVGTAYHHMGRIKASRDANGVIVDTGGVDCAQLIWAIFYNCGLTEFLPPAHYPPDWHLNRGLEKFMAVVQARAHEVTVPLPGDVVLYRFGRAFAHGGIVVDPGWPRIVHAHFQARTVMIEDGAAGKLAGRPVKFFSRW